MNNPTTLRYPRQMRKTGTELAGCIEHHKRTDYSGVTIVLICGVILAVAIVHAWIGG